MTEEFSKEEFEAALPVHKATNMPLWTYKGVEAGEHSYLIKIDNKTAIEVRSSVRVGGKAAATGKDSIRAWLIELPSGGPLGSKVSTWTTRRPGWQNRIKDVIRTLWSWRKKAGDCSCGQPKKVFKVKKEGSPHIGRVFANCRDCQNSFIWLT